MPSIDWGKDMNREQLRKIYKDGGYNRRISFKQFKEYYKQKNFEANLSFDTSVKGNYIEEETEC